MYVRPRHTKLRRLREFLTTEVAPYLKDASRKPAARQAAEAWRLFRTYRVPPYQYLKLGLYSSKVKEDVESYIPPILIYRLQGKLNDKTSPMSRRISNSKVNFRTWAEENSLPAVRELISIDTTGRILDPAQNEIDEARALSLLRAHEGDLFVKPIDGIFGDAAAVLGQAALGPGVLAGQRNLLVQPRLVQHPVLKAIHPNSINTVRIDTLLTPEGVAHNAAMLRMGAGGRAIDNSGAGGLSVGIDLATGALFAVARSRARYGLREFTAHPDTGAVFAGTFVPFWDEVKAVVVRAAEAARPLGSLGWDVVITPEGPVLLEVNFNWGVNAIQNAWGGLGKTPIGLMARRLHGLPDWPAAAAPAPAARGPAPK